MNAFVAALLILGGLVIAFFGRGFVRVAAGLVAGIWFAYSVSSSMGVSLGGQVIGTLISILVFIVFFTTGMMLYREVLSLFLGFYLSDYILRYFDVSTALHEAGLTFLDGGITYIALSLVVAVIMYVAFRWAVALGLSIVGSALVFKGATFFAGTIPGIAVSLVVFAVSFWRNLRREKKPKRKLKYRFRPTSFGRRSSSLV